MNRIHRLSLKLETAHHVVVLLCLAFAFAFGLRQLKAEPARPADINSIKGMYVSRSHPDYSINDVIRFVATQDASHLPLYHVALSLWIRYGGRDLFSVRLLSLFTGLLAIAATYRLARITGGRKISLDTTIMVSFLAFFIFYTHQARMYALLALASVWVVGSYWRLLISSRAMAPRWWLSLLASCVTIMYTHYFGFFLLAAICAYHLFFAPKNRRWLQICLAIGGAGLLFVPWLPYTLSILRIRDVPSSDALAVGDALIAFSSIYSNGLPIAFVAAAVALAFRFRRLKRSQAFILVLSALIFSLLLTANEFTALIIARRIRYTIAAGILLICALAIALNLLPGWRMLRLPFLGGWIVLFFTYWASDELYLYTNQLDQRQNSVPHYQDLLYVPSINPRNSDFVVSVHRDTALNEKKQLDYYGRKTGNWRGLIHISNDADGDPALQSTDTRYQNLSSMEIWNFPIWLIHNPQETDLHSMDAFTTDFLHHFHSCGRFLETDASIIDLYVKRHIPCELLTAPQPLEIAYENGTELANILLQRQADELSLFLWWTNTIANQYAFSLQLFDADGGMTAQLDDVIGGAAVTANSLDVAALPAGEYTAKLILYDYETLVSQPGAILAGQRHFEREVEVARLRLGD